MENRNKDIHKLFLRASLFTLLMCSVAFNVKAQKNYFPGTLIFKNGDTIPCFIKKAEQIHTRSRVPYIRMDNRKNDTASIKDLTYMVFCGERFDVVQNGKKHLFLKLVVDGYLKLYTVKYTATHFMPGVPGVPGSMGAAYSREEESFYIKKADAPTCDLSGRHYKKRISEYLKDQPHLVEKLDTEGFMYKDLKNIVSTYNSMHSEQ